MRSINHIYFELLSIINNYWSWLLIQHALVAVTIWARWTLCIAVTTWDSLFILRIKLLFILMWTLWITWLLLTWFIALLMTVVLAWIFLAHAVLTNVVMTLVILTRCFMTLLTLLVAMFLTCCLYNFLNYMLVLSVFTIITLFIVTWLFIVATLWALFFFSAICTITNIIFSHRAV